MEVHFVFQADDAEISVLGAYIDIADGTTTTAKRQDGKRATSHAKRSCGSSHKTTPLSEASKINAGVSTDSASAASSVIETIFASVGDIATPGTVTTTAALTMSDIVSFLQGTTFRT